MILQNTDKIGQGWLFTENNEVLHQLNLVFKDICSNSNLKLQLLKKKFLFGFIKMNSTINLLNQTILQTNNYFTLVDYSLFGILLAVSAAIGLYFGCFGDQEQTTEEYLQGGHKMKTVPIAISLVAR